jgi:hypothetical protein
MECVELQLDRGISWEEAIKWQKYYNKNPTNPRSRAKFFKKTLNASKGTGKVVVLVKPFTSLASSSKKVTSIFSLHIISD